MKSLRSVLSVLMLVVALGMAAQIVTSEPAPLQRGSMGVVLTYYADSPLGNRALVDLPENTDVYAHIGLLTSKSASSGDWKYVPFPWPSTGNSQTANTDLNRLTRVATNTYTLTIDNIETYFGITDASETVTDIALVFRTGDGSKQGKTAEDQDIFVPVYPDGYQIMLTSDAESNLLAESTTITFTINASAASNLDLSVNGTSIASAANAMVLTKAYTFSSYGTFDVVATGTLDGTVRTESVQIAYPDNSGNKPYPGGGRPKMGAVRNADGSVTFCLAAPNKKSALIVGAWDDYSESNVMNYCDYEGQRYFWLTIPDLPADQWIPYYYVVDNIYKISDPYAHLILHPSEDNSANMNNAWPDRPRYPSDKVTNGVILAVYRGDMDDYDWDPFTIPEHDNLVIYELLLRDFTGVNGAAAGNGNLAKAMDRIPYLKSLGVNVIELMPIMEFNGNSSWGYNTNFYMAPDKIYGSPTAYKDFINECHRNGMAVVLDIVFNQSDGNHPWYKLYPRATNPFYNVTAPHQYSVLNDWNQGNPLVQQQWTDALTYWMTAYNVDGFRFDLVKGLGDNESYTQAGGTEQYNQSRVDRMIRLHNVIKSVKPNGIHINEDLAGVQEEKALGNDGQLQWANVNDASCQYTMGWDNGNNNLFRFLSTSDGGRPWGTTVSYAESHDEERMAYKNATWGVDGVKLPADTEETITTMSLQRLGSLAVQMLMTPGPKMIWQFGELGNGQSTKSASGDNNTGTKIVCWNYLEDPGRVALKDTYAEVINLRMNNPELFGRNATFKASGIGSKFTSQRTMRLTAGNKEAIAFINPAISGTPMTIQCDATLISESNNQLISATAGFVPTLLNGDTGKVTVAVPANSYAIFATKNVTGLDDAELSPATVNVYGSDGEIVLAGDYSAARVFTLNGVEIAALSRGGLNRLEVPAGLYLVTVDGTAHKVLVR